MKVKFLAAAALSLAAATCMATGPANADNKAALNNLAMQMYMQNQSAAYNPYAYNPYAMGATNYAAGAVPYAGGSPSWAAGAMPYGYTNPYVHTNPYYGSRNTYFHHGWWR